MLALNRLNRSESIPSPIMKKGLFALEVLSQLFAWMYCNTVEESGGDFRRVGDNHGAYQTARGKCITIYHGTWYVLIVNIFNATTRGDIAKKIINEIINSQ